MQIRKFTVGHIREAILAVKSEMGPDAVIMSIRTIKGKNGRAALEVTASKDTAQPAAAAELAATESRPVEAGAKALPFTGGGRPALSQEANLSRLIAELTALSGRLEEIQRNLNPENIAVRLENFAKGLDHLQALLDDANGGSVPPELAFEGALSAGYERLLKAGIAPVYAKELIELTSRQLSSRSLAPDVYGLEYLAAAVMDHIRTATPFAPGRDQQIHMIIGPTGVGKTTTIAKLAARQVFEMNRSVALLTVDTFRISAVDQLRTYARILNVPVEVCMSDADLAQAALKHADKDTLFIDTAGASPKDMRMMGELVKFHQTGIAMDVHLILAATTAAEDLRDIVDRYSALPIASLIVSKLDEANNFGNLYNLMQQTRIPCSYFTVGQNVPDDIEEATPERVADLLLDVAAQV
ncbi:MAG: flagellar biosynthesis protein FlhF [Myxococcales bacterium]|nr:flagellar biosynthesis protein FlhF [Myxococcales bacterium]